VEPKSRIYIKAEQIYKRQRKLHPQQRSSPTCVHNSVSAGRHELVEDKKCPRECKKHLQNQDSEVK